MTNFCITHRIEAPALIEALNGLSEALKSRSAAVLAAAEITSAHELKMPVATSTAPTVEASVDNPIPTDSASIVPLPFIPEQTTPAPVQHEEQSVSAEKDYTFDDITAAGSQLLEQGKMEQLMDLLKSYGVQAVTQLKSEQYADVAAGLRNLGAKI